jgi:hypothetical protein
LGQERARAKTKSGNCPADVPDLLGQIAACLVLPQDVGPVWQVVTMSAAQAAAYQQPRGAQTQPVTSDLTPAINAPQSANWSTFTAVQQTAVMRRLLQIARVLVRRAGGR